MKNSLMEKILGNTKLLYRGSRDGFTHKAFHSLCDNQGPTIILIRSSQEQVFGGYASVSWNSEGEKFGDGKSFLF